MARSNENNKDQITFFGNENKPVDNGLSDFVNDEHYESAEAPKTENVPPVKKSASPSAKRGKNESELTLPDAEVAPEHTVRPQKVTVSKEIKPQILPKKEKSYFWQFDYRKSLILTFIVFLSNHIGKAFRNSFFAQIFTSFSRAGAKFSESYLYRLITTPKSLKIRNGLKKTIRHSATKAFLPTLFANFFASLTKIKTRIYGFIFLSFGITTALVHFFIQGIFERFSANSFTPITASIVIVASIFLLSSGKTLTGAVKDSVLMSALLFNFLGIKRPQFNEVDELYFPVSGACIIGVILGALTLFLPAHSILALILLLIYTYISVKYPETGVISFIMFMPFLNVSVMVYIASAISIAYIFKILSGKRTPSFEFPDIFIAIFLLLTLFAEMTTFGTRQTLFTASAFILMYFLCVCTLCEKTWFERAVNAIILGTLVYSAYSIFASFLADPLGVTLDNPANLDGGISDATVLNSTSVITAMLVCGIFYILASFFTTKSKSNKISYILIICVSLVFLFREASIITLIAVTIGLLLFLILMSSKTLILVVAAAVILPLLPLFNSGVYSGVASIIEQEEYRLEIWSAVINMLYRYGITGIGYAPNAFSTLYATYYVGNTTSVPHAHSLVFQILISLGALGLIVFAIILFFLLQSSFSFGRNSSNKLSKSRLMCYAGMCTVTTLVISGIGEYIWYNPRIMLLFWLACGLTVCARRSSNELSDTDKLMLELNANYNG